MIATLWVASALAGSTPPADLRGGVVRGLVGFPDLVGAEAAAHLGGWHLGLGYSNLIIVSSGFVRGGPEWVLSSAQVERGARAVLFSPALEYRAFTHTHLETVQHGGSATAGLEWIAPTGGGWFANARLDAGATWLFSWQVLPYARLRFGVGFMPRKE